GDLSADAIGRGNYRGFGDFRLFLQEFFDFARINVEAAGDNQVAFAAGERVIAVFGARGEVSGAEVSVVKSLAGGLFAAPIADKNVGSAQINLAGFAVGNRIMCGIEQAQGDSGEGKSHAAGASFADIRVAQVH